MTPTPGQRKPKNKERSADLRALTKAIAWIERSSSQRMKRATAEYIYDRYVRHPSR